MIAPISHRIRAACLLAFAVLSAALVFAISPAAADHCADPTADICDETSPTTVYDPFADPANWCDPPYFPDYQSDPYCNGGGTEPIPVEDPSVATTVFDAVDAPSPTTTWVVTDAERQALCDPAIHPDPASDPLCSENGSSSGGAAVNPPDTLAFDAAVTPLQALQTDDPLVDLPESEAPTVSAGRMLLAIDALAELGAFQRSGDPIVSSLLRDIRDGVPGDGLTDAGYRSEVRRLVEDLDEYVDDLERRGVTVNPTVWDALDPLLDGDLDRLDAGETLDLDAEAWLNALADLDAGGDDGQDLAGAPAVESRIRALTATFAVSPAAEIETPSTTVATIPEPSVATSVETIETPTVIEDGGSLLPFAIGGVVALALAAWLLVRRKSSGTAGGAAQAVGASGSDASSQPRVATASANTPSDAGVPSRPQPGLGNLLDASRRMSGTLDETVIAAIGLTEAKKLVNAEAGLIVRRDGSVLRSVSAEPSELFRPLDLAGGSLQRVVETGQPVAAIASDEPVLVEVPMAMAAVAIVADGTVAGALLVARVPSQPFDRADLDALEMLAPLIGSAYQAADAHNTATALADVEPLTGLNNRRRLDNDLAAISADDQVAYVMVDIDHFKNFNDTNGHAAGDEALRQVAALLEAAVRPGDHVYRYGGEEFCVLLPGATAEEAKGVAERARTAIEAAPIPGRENQPAGCVTISVGVSDSAFGVPASLVERADAALYEAKRSGRNQVMIEDRTAP